MKMSKSTHFSTKELQCSCGCGTCNMDKDFLGLLDEIREEAGKPVHLSSAYRCGEYNKKVSNTGLCGPHTTGLAVDIRCSGKDAHDILTLALELGVHGVGISQKGAHSTRFIHIDMLPYGNLRPWIWSY